MKTNHRYGAIVRCDVVHRTETEEEIIDTNQCEEKFHTASIPRLARAQAANAKWKRVKAKLVKWPGQPPIADNKKVDICPKHARLVMTAEELAAKRKSERDSAKAAKAAQPKRPRKKPSAEATPF